MTIRTALSAVNVLAVLLGVFCVTIVGQRQAQCCKEYCYDLDTERLQSAHFATKTSYLIAKGPENGRQFLVPSMFECLSEFSFSFNYKKFYFSYFKRILFSACRL